MPRQQRGPTRLHVSAATFFGGGRFKFGAALVRWHLRFPMADVFFCRLATGLVVTSARPSPLVAACDTVFFHTGLTGRQPALDRTSARCTGPGLSRAPSVTPRGES
jgi:hypothetical protein